MIQVQPYKPRIPISGGGGVSGIDLRNRSAPRSVGRTAAQGMQGQIVTEGGKTWLVDRRTGQKIDIGIKPSPKVEELLKLIEFARQYEEPSEFERAIGESAERDLAQRRGVELPTVAPAAPPAAPATEPAAGGFLSGIIGKALGPRPAPGEAARLSGTDIPGVVGTRKKGTKPKDYPDAKWSDEHQMWVVTRNGRLMGVE